MLSSAHRTLAIFNDWRLQVCFWTALFVVQCQDQICARLNFTTNITAAKEFVFNVNKGTKQLITYEVINDCTNVLGHEIIVRERLINGTEHAFCSISLDAFDSNCECHLLEKRQICNLTVTYSKDRTEFSFGDDKGMIKNVSLRVIYTDKDPELFTAVVDSSAASTRQETVTTSGITLQPATVPLLAHVDPHKDHQGLPMHPFSVTLIAVNSTLLIAMAAFILLFVHTRKRRDKVLVRLHRDRQLDTEVAGIDNGMYAQITNHAGRTERPPENTTVPRQTESLYLEAVACHTRGGMLYHFVQPQETQMHHYYNQQNDECPFLSFNMGLHETECKSQ